MPRASWLIVLSAINGIAADVTGLQPKSEITITAQMAGAPAESAIPPSVWGISFSHDNKYLAVGVQFFRMNDANLATYLLIVSPDQPGKVLRRFEMPRQPARRNESAIDWSRDGRFLTVPYVDRTAIIDIDASQLHFIPARDGELYCSGPMNLLSGPRIAQSLLAREWCGHRWSVFPESTGICDAGMELSSRGQTLGS